jgi:hypothetical protein
MTTKPTEPKEDEEDLPEFAGGKNRTEETDAGKPDEPYRGYVPSRFRRRREEDPNYDTTAEKRMDFEED